MKKRERYVSREAILEVYRKDWKKKMGKRDEKDQKKQKELDELITHVGYDDAQLGREK